MAKKFAWSYSALTGFETCPKQFYHLRVRKDIKERESKELRYGNYVHKALEERVKNNKPLPSDLKQHEKLASRFVTAKRAGHEVLCERNICLTEGLEETDYFGKDAWLRMKVDVQVSPKGQSRIRAYDYKTGKRKADSDQLKLTAATIFATDPDVEEVETYFLWLLSREVDKAVYTREDEPIIWQEFEPRVATMIEAHEHVHYPARPSGLCRGWCPVRTCEHWEEKT